MALNEELVFAIKNGFLARLRERSLISEERKVASTVDLNNEFFNYLVEEQYYDFNHIHAVAKEIQWSSGIEGANQYYINDEIITTEFNKRLDNKKLNQAVNEFKLWIKSLKKSDLQKKEFSDDKKKYCSEKVLWYFLTKEANLGHIQGYVGFCAFAKQLKEQALLLNWKKKQVFPPSFEEFKPHFEEAKKRTMKDMILDRAITEAFFPLPSKSVSLFVMMFTLISASRYLTSSFVNRPTLNCWCDEAIGNHSMLNVLCETNAYPTLENCIKEQEQTSCTDSFSHLPNGTIEMSLWRRNKEQNTPQSDNVCSFSSFFDCAVKDGFSFNFQRLPDVDVTSTSLEHK